MRGDELETIEQKKLLSGSILRGGPRKGTAIRGHVIKDPVTCSV